MLNENLRTLRKAKGLSQEELADRLHVVRQTISKWEKGISVPDAGMLMRIAEELETSVNVLLGAPIAQEEEPEPVEVLAEKLEALNEQFARQNENRRRRWRIAFTVIGILAAVSLVYEILGAVHAVRANSELVQNAAVIGGVDAATSIYISSVKNYTWLASGIAAAVSVAGIIRTKRR